jgi:hypothetical protein
MVGNKHCEPYKYTFASWMDKALNQSLSKTNINSKQLKVTRIWPFNLKTVDNKTRPNEVYTSLVVTYIPNNDNEIFDDIEQLGGNGVTT